MSIESSPQGTEMQMKKYFYFLFVAIFATMSVALTSCGDDDDEPSAGGKYSCNLTVNGTKFPAKTIAGEVWNHNGFDALTVWVNDATNDNYLIFETTEIESLSNGVNITNDCSIDLSLSDDTFVMGAEVRSGNVTVTNVDLNEKTITVQFSNAKFNSPMGGDVTLNGTFTSPLNGSDNKTKL